jgi:hypothetical protein
MMQHVSCIREIKYRTSTAKATFNKKKTLFASKLDLNLRKKLVKCYIWNIAVYGAETRTLRKVDRKYLERYQKWCWRRMKKIIWNDCVTNEKVLERSKRRGISYKKHEKWRLTGLVTSCVRTAL